MDIDVIITMTFMLYQHAILCHIYNMYYPHINCCQNEKLFCVILTIMCAVNIIIIIGVLTLHHVSVTPQFDNV